MEPFLDANLLNWDDRAELHATDKTGSYRIENVLAGGSNLYELETREVGDIFGKDIVHLQCHIGLDTISLRNLGAGSVTGLDFSPRAIAAARDFASKAGSDVRFVEAPLYEAVEALDRTFDIVYVTWGSVNWLDDVFRWARVVADLLRPGGRLYMAEGHPLMFQCNRKAAALELKDDWRTPVARPLVWNEQRTYTGDERTLKHPRYYEWIHPISDVVNALITAGLTLDFLNEHDTVSWQHFSFAVRAGKDMYGLPENAPKIPMAYSIGATKRGVGTYRIVQKKVDRH